MSHQPLSDGFGERCRMTGLCDLRGQVGGEVLGVRLAPRANIQIAPEGIEGRRPHGRMHSELGEGARFQAQLLAHIGHRSGGKLGGIREQGPLYLRTVLALDRFPIHVTADAAFDYWYIYDTAAHRDGIAAIPLGHPWPRGGAS